MKKLIVIIVIIVSFMYLKAEEWNLKADISLMMNQNYYSDNWAGEEMGSISWVSNVNMLAEKQLNPKIHNKNTLKLAFGQTHNQYIEEETGDKKWASPDKSTDLIDFETIIRFTLGAFVDPYVSGKIESQFLDQSIEEETKPLNPNVIIESFGMSKIFTKTERKEFSMRLGGSFRQYLNHHEDIYNTNDGGLEFIADYKTPISDDNITFSSIFNVYKALYHSESEDLEDTEYEDDWKTPRINWKNTLIVNLSKLISMNLYFEMIYNETDYDNDGKSIDEIQYKQTLSLGINYKIL